MRVTNDAAMRPNGGVPWFMLAVLMVVLSATLWGTGLLMPIFLQELMGYTAWRAGLMMVPRAAAAMFSMFAVGQLARLKVEVEPIALPTTASPAAREVADGFALAFALNDLEHPGEPITFRGRSPRNGWRAPTGMCGAGSASS